VALTEIKSGEPEFIEKEVMLVNKGEQIGTL
jgi:hypothetical protein